MSDQESVRDYSLKEEIDAFIKDVNQETTCKRRPMLVLDMDGNFAIGYNLISDKRLPRGKEDEPNLKRQRIPFKSNIQQLLEDRDIEPAIFAKAGMDLRIPREVVKLLNENIAKGVNPDRKFDIVILTSRNHEELIKILKASGVEKPENLTLIADSGAIMYVGGEINVLHPLSDEENTFLNGIPSIAKELESKIDDIIREMGKDIDPPWPVKGRPRLFVEEKLVAKNIHWREVLAYYNQNEGSALDQAINSAVKARLDDYITRKSPQEDGEPVFKTKDGPATVETIIASVDKGKALRAVVEAAKAEEYIPSAIVYSGDDICKGKSPGTEFPAFTAAPDIARDFDIPVYTAHTHHPVSEKLGDPKPVPDPNKAASNVGIRPDIIVPDPVKNAKLMVDITKRARELAEPKDKMEASDIRLWIEDRIKSARDRKLNRKLLHISLEKSGITR